MNEDNSVIDLVKSLLIESYDLPENVDFNPQMYYLITLYIMEFGLDFYSNDIFKFFIFKGYHYFKSKKLNNEDKFYMKIFEYEIRNWSSSIMINDFEFMVFDFLNGSKNKIILEIHKRKSSFLNIEKHVNDMASQLKIKFEKRNIGNAKDDLFDKMFDNWE